MTLKLISQLEKATGLTLVNDDETEGNVCFANDTALRPAFKTTFTEKDIKNYILGLTQSQNITVPKDAENFWKIAGLGGQTLSN